MTAQLRVVSGVRAGLVVPLWRGTIAVGRQPDMDIRFGPDDDLEVSGRHAIFLQVGTKWTVRDLGSTNGTFVNGVPVEDDAVLSSGDRITLGRGGPIIEFQVDVADKSRNRVLVTTALVVILAGIATAFFVRSRNSAHTLVSESPQSNAAPASETARDSVHELEAQLAKLTAALQATQEQVRLAQLELDGAEGKRDSQQIQVLRHQLQEATTQLVRQQLAAGLDFTAIQAGNRRAIARIYTESASGDVATATAFAVRNDGTLITSRHALIGPGKVRAHRIGIQFSDSEQVWPARVLMLSPDADLALVKVDRIEGVVPTVRMLNARADTIAAGAPVALIGFTLGGAERPETRVARIARPLLSAGVISSMSPGQMELQGYGAAGASGSPVFNATGAVVGVLYAGRRDSGGETLLAVPIAFAFPLLASAK